ncbi:cation:proton antiporter [Lyngbya confervoides]|uniref:Cation:proton antiporter n=1 Tax=Lyngbya confervoides BDU141951 TaxID=1574623 RepID=A0ABD4T482_9CYAN|nr:cation:proton antiporter [Lyngbya confervoides]MCM1983390.1 cation:proton antiporter [Lyngbya confervoides BDU141951]
MPPIEVFRTLIPGNFPSLLAITSESEAGPVILTGVLLSLVVIYFASKLGAELSRYLSLPPVLGELIAGVLVGVSAFQLILFPEDGITASNSNLMSVIHLIEPMTDELADLIFKTQSEVISVLAEIGVIILLFEIGLESELRELGKVGYQAAIVACVGVAAPFAAGTLGLIALFHVPAIPAIFAGAALTATSIGITSKVLSELGHLKSREGQIIVGAAVIDDVLGIIVLAVVASLAKTGEVDLMNVLFLIVGATVFLLGAILLGKFFNQAFVSLAQTLKTRGNLVIPAFIFAFFMAFVGNAIHLEAILGAFAAGLVLDETDTRKELDEQVRPIADVLVPIFFVTVGAKVNLGVLNPVVPENREGLIIAGFLIVVAIVGKVISGWSIVGNNEPVNRLAVGVGMIPRGEVGLVFAGIGAASGALSPALQAAIIVMVILTTFIAPPFLQLALKSSEAPEQSLDASN